MYVESNVSMYELAKYRRSQVPPLPAICIDFPITGGVGRLSEVRNTMELELNIRKGFPLISINQLPKLWEHILWNQHVLPPHVAIDAPRWESYLRLDRYSKVWRHLCMDEAAKMAGPTSFVDAASSSNSRGPVNRSKLLQDVKEQIAAVLGAEPDEVEDDVNIIELGVDSLASIEIINFIKSKYAVEVQQSDVLEGISANALTDLVINSVGHTDLVQDSEDDDIYVQEAPAESHPATHPTVLSPELATESSLKSSDTIDVRRTSSGLTVDLLVESLNGHMLQDILAAVASASDLPLVFKSSSGSFCTGMDLDGAKFGDDVMSQGLELFAALHRSVSTSTTTSASSKALSIPCAPRPS